MFNENHCDVELEPSLTEICTSRQTTKSLELLKLRLIWALAFVELEPLVSVVIDQGLESEQLLVMLKVSVSSKSKWKLHFYRNFPVMLAML